MDQITWSKLTRTFCATTVLHVSKELAGNQLQISSPKLIWLKIKYGMGYGTQLFVATVLAQLF